jgi:hypothetical protein
MIALFLLCLAGAPADVASGGVESAIGAPPADAVVDVARRKPVPRRKAAKKRRAAGGDLEIPIDVGVGPVLLWGNPPLGLDQIAHFGLGFEAAAVIDPATLRRFEDQIPANLRKQARSLGQVRIRPWWLALVPELLVISPAFWNTGVYGAVWRPFGLGVTLLDEPVRVSADAAIDLAYFFIHSSTLPEPTHFLRPGLNLRLNVEIPLTDSLRLATGWSSDFFVPQPLGRPPWEILPLDPALWHMGGPYLMLHVRFPYRMSL